MKMIPCSQHRFQAGKSTITALGAATHDWKASKQSGLEVGCLLFDLSAAFDQDFPRKVPCTRQYPPKWKIEDKWYCSFPNVREYNEA
jgi:hypothetical protein